ncbi:hypothetical protein A3C32_01570 [Candidatus Daviesbacteria bacterium RIFCSPHIGHO2_02_FULL_41_14]|nr:MAG: hypothetical protein A3C32_01570 [Candidatus Daviesbacteria bacterium RIFCSPHIGHO2_02_FULL_41_14]
MGDGIPYTSFLISPIYQAIQGFKDSPIRSGAGDANYVELILLNFLSQFNNLMAFYQDKDDTV